MNKAPDGLCQTLYSQSCLPEHVAGRRCPERGRQCFGAAPVAERSLSSSLNSEQQQRQPARTAHALLWRAAHFGGYGSANGPIASRCMYSLERAQSKGWSTGYHLA